MNNAMMTDLRLASIVFLVGSCCIIGVFQKRISSFAGPYRVILVKVTNVSEELKSTHEVWFTANAKQVRGKKPQYVWGWFKTDILFDDTYNVEVNLAARVNNRWKKNAIAIKLDKGCTNALIHAEDLIRLLYGPGYDLTCPIKPIGFRVVPNQTVDLRFPRFPMLPYGRYLVNVLVEQGPKVVGGGEVEVDIVPRL